MSSWNRFWKRVGWRTVVVIPLTILLLMGIYFGLRGSAQPLLKMRIAPSWIPAYVDNGRYFPEVEAPQEIATYDAVIVFSLMWAGLGIVVGFIIRNLYITSRDTDLWDMGDVELAQLIGSYKDEQERRKNG